MRDCRGQQWIRREQRGQRLQGKTALAESKAPVLFIHGSKDDFVPSYMTDINFDTCSSKKHKIIASEAPHGYSFLYATDEIKGAIKNLIFNN